MPKIESMTVEAVLLIFLWCHLLPLPVFSAENPIVTFKVHAERNISSDNMNIDYELEDHGKNLYNFEYPKLVLVDRDGPLVAYIDENSKRILFVRILERGFQIVHSVPRFDERRWRWPIIFEREGRIYLALIPTLTPNDDPDHINLLLLDKNSGQLILQKDWRLNLERDHTVTGFYPCGDKFLGTASYSQICLRYVPLLVFGELIVFYHNDSFILDAENVSKTQPIDEKGCFSARKTEYVASELGLIHGAWFRDTTAAMAPHDEMLYYSYMKNGSRWESPVELYAIRATYTHWLNSLSLAANDDSAYLLWQDTERGIFFCEMKYGKNIEFAKISNIKRERISSEPLWSASTIKIAADARGNAYALWTLNTGDNYQLFFKARINGQWSREYVIGSGPGCVKLPDMKIDKRGKIHVVYLKSRYPEEARPVKFDCYYTAIERQE